MTMIRTTCGQCGVIELSVSDILLVFTGQDKREGTYEFTCPHCEEAQERPANRNVVSILLATGIQYELRIQFPKLTEEIISLLVENFNMRDADSIMREIEQLGY